MRHLLLLLSLAWLLPQELLNFGLIRGLPIYKEKNYETSVLPVLRGVVEC